MRLDEVVTKKGPNMEEQEPKKNRFVPLLAAITISSIVGSGLFVMTFTGTFLGKKSADKHNEEPENKVMAEGLPKVAFLPIEPLLVSLGAAAEGRQLRFEGYLEVQPEYSEDVVQMMPRIMDVLNTYLRAVDYSDVEEPSSLLKLRLQMLRRVQIVVGEGRVNDLLVSKFVLG